MRFCRITYFLAFLFFYMSALAQKDSVLALTKGQWKELIEGVDYTETFKEPQKDNAKATTINNTNFNFGDFKYVIYLFLFALIIFITVKVFGNYGNNAEVKEKIVSIESIDEVAENMHEINLEELLKAALMAKNYRIALRLNFLIIIKLLSQKGKIVWANEKTNWEYYRELSNNKHLAEQFREIILNFELFWYGERQLTKLQYESATLQYEAIQSKLTSSE